MRKTVAMVVAVVAGACDAPRVTVDRGVQIDPVAETPFEPGTTFDPIEGEDRPEPVTPEPGLIVIPTDASWDERFGDNQVCDNADTFVGDVVTAKVSGDVRPEGCYATGLTTIGSFWVVVLEAREAAHARITSPTRTDGYLWLTAGPACDTDPGERFEGCRADWTHQADGLVLTNPSDEQRAFIVAAVADERMRGAAFQVELQRDVLAANASCADALPITAGRVEDQRISQAGVALESAPVWRMLYYSVVVPPLTRMRATIDFGDAQPSDIYPYFMSSCTPGELEQWSSIGEITNSSDAPMTVMLGVGTNWSSSAEAFAIVLDETPLSPRADCASPAVLALGDATEVDLEAGGQGPTVCWCLSPTRSVYVDVEVPAGATVELVASVAGGDAMGRVDFIELDGACASECGQNAAFGFDGGAVLALANPGPTAVTKHVLVAGSAGWEQADNHAPTAGLRVRQQGTE